MWQAKIHHFSCLPCYSDSKMNKGWQTLDNETCLPILEWLTSTLHETVYGPTAVQWLWQHGKEAGRKGMKRCLQSSLRGWHFWECLRPMVYFSCLLSFGVDISKSKNPTSLTFLHIPQLYPISLKILVCPYMSAYSITCTPLRLNTSAVNQCWPSVACFENSIIHKWGKNKQTNKNPFQILFLLFMILTWIQK